MHQAFFNESLRHVCLQQTCSILFRGGDRRRSTGSAPEPTPPNLLQKLPPSASNCNEFGVRASSLRTCRSGCRIARSSATSSGVEGLGLGSAGVRACGRRARPARRRSPASTRPPARVHRPRVPRPGRVVSLLVPRSPPPVKAARRLAPHHHHGRPSRGLQPACGYAHGGTPRRQGMSR